MHLVLPAVLAVLAAALVALGTLVRQRSSTVRGGITKRWWLGVAIAALGFVLQAVALGLGSLLLVQPLIVLSVLFALPLEAHLDRRRLNVHEWKWGVILTLCIAAFVLITMPTPGKHNAQAGVLAGAIVVLVVVLGGLMVGARFVSLHYRALLYGAASGLLTGVQSFLVKGVMGQLDRSVGEIFVHPELYLIIVVATGSVLTQQLAFAAHDLQTSFPAMTVMEPAVGMALGVVLLGERAHVSTFEGFVVAFILGVMMFATVILAKHAAERETAFEVCVEKQRSLTA
ncbi:DMT family transporter [Jongsikchunia kroppenstedtii]|uniref:DMT family transporter n=1 Tax=Jongsikchunia kroppenstedtii TaxID=1121721 RepID=UPI0003725695|nr:DMT family transporter [Jongsikchunia kroppenstedtii]